MTCIVGVIDRGTGDVVIGGDSAGVDGWNLDILTNAKVFVRTSDRVEWGFGFSTSYRMGQLVQHVLELPNALEIPSADLERFLVREFVPRLRDCLRDGGWLKREQEREESGNILVGLHGRLFSIQGTLQVLESTLRFDAIGSGGPAALGALHAMSDDPQLATDLRVIRALCAAEALSAAVRGPFVTVRARVAP